MILVDSSVWIDYFNGNTTPQVERLDRLLDTQPLAIGDLILTEVLQGFRQDSDYTTAKKLIDVFLITQNRSPHHHHTQSKVPDLSPV